MKSTLVFLAFTTVLSFHSYAQSWREKLDSVLTSLQNQDFFDGQVLIAEKGQILFNSAYGSSVNDGVEESVRETTSFNVESVSKAITSAAILMLCDQKQLNLVDPISKYYPDLPFPDVTIKDLLAMTSGIPRFLSTVLQHGDTSRVISNDGIIELIEKHQPQGNPPGERFQYNNANYILLASIIEQVSGQALQAFLEENIFMPLQMQNTSLVLPEILDSLVTVDNFYQAYGAGNIHTSAKDLFLFIEGLKSNKLLSKTSLALTYSPIIFKEKQMSAYGLGWHISFDQNSKEVYLIGDGRNVRASVQNYEDTDRQLIYIHTRTNEYHKEVHKVIKNIWEGKPYSIPEKRRRYEIDTNLYDKYIGSYLTKFGLVHITREKDKLFLRPDPVPGKEELIPSSDSTFYFNKQNIEWEFFFNGQKEVIGFGIRGDKEHMGTKEK